MKDVARLDRASELVRESLALRDELRGLVATAGPSAAPRRRRGELAAEA